MLGVEWDEGPIYQSDRLDRYRERAEELIASGKAYRCYCTVEELEADRAGAEKAGKPYRYSGVCRARAEAGDPQAPDEPHVIRFKVSPGAIEFHDLIRGDVRFEGELIDDFVILRSDTFPTYHLSVVVDDIDMEITHVARGDDHLSNTPKHILLFRAFGATVPIFAHLPLILGSDRKRLSKRTGTTSAEEYRDLGIVPQALFNFLMLLGWSPGHDREIFTRDELVAAFTLEGISGGNAVFNPEKLDWFNQQHLMRVAPDELARRLKPSFEQAGVWSDDYLDDRHAWFYAVLELLKPRARRLGDFATQGRFFFADALEYDAAAIEKHLRSSGMEGHLTALDHTFALLDTFDPASTEASLRAVADGRGVKAASLIHAVRVAVTGKAVSPGLFEVMSLLGRNRVHTRLAAAERLLLPSTS